MLFVLLEIILQSSVRPRPQLMRILGLGILQVTPPCELIWKLKNLGRPKI
ncbi:unnamed protein product [Brugia timori]|uniref:Uncharacterized protein n=1 Tax=Brugia timori TaxID=42155 RepID=A0A0R3QHM2_9BILA|nr:unnamed protein product [Brugia timori]